MPDWEKIAAHIAASTGKPFRPRPPSSQSGGCINTAVRLADEHGAWFVKLNQADRLDMFEAEYAGLQELAASGSLTVPQPLCTGIAGNSAYIVMGFIRLRSGSRTEQIRAAEQLAGLHQHEHGRFGWYRDNTIGSTTQHNAWSHDWTVFWQQHRLGFQLELAASNGHRGRLQSDGEKLLEALPALLDHNPRPSLLHGDLWSGNLAFDSDGHAVIYDPAVYFGDREAELAMTELFGGFDPAFHQAYQATWPMDPGYTTRKHLYNLYHILNHLNMFGGGYLGQAQRMTSQLLAAVH